MWQIDFNWLHKQMSERMNIEEINSLCFFLGIDYENIRGDTKDSKIRELLLYIQRRQQIPNLLERLKAIRPDIWGDEQIMSQTLRPEDFSGQEKQRMEHKNHIQELINNVQNNLRSVQKRKSLISIGDSAWITLENLESRYQEELKKLKDELDS